MATTYAELKSEIESWLDSDNPNMIAAIPQFIQDAETWMTRKLWTLEMECQLTVPLNVTGMYDLPPDWKSHKSVERSQDSLIVLYFRRIVNLSDTVATNWVLEKHPDLYRYASLAAAEAWYKNDPRAANPFGARAIEILSEVIEQDDRGRNNALFKYEGVPQKKPGQVAANLEGRSGTFRYVEPDMFFHIKGVGGALQYSSWPGFYTTHQQYLEIYPSKLPGDS
jgi:hypothetical protein